MVMLVGGRHGRRLFMLMTMRRVAFVAIGRLHDRVVVAQRERRGDECRRLAGQPDRRHEPDVRTDAHHQIEYPVG
jgi:hypothetical protein